MSILTKIRRNTFMKKRAQKLERWLKKKTTRFFIKPIEVQEVRCANDLDGIQRILIIRPNYRIGNALISTPVLEFFSKKYPNAKIDLLATQSTALMFENFGVNKIYTMAREFGYKPWQLLGLLRTLRRNHYDLVVDVTAGSLTSYLCARFIHSRYTIGEKVRGCRVYNVEIEGAPGHAYDIAVPFANAYGDTVRRRPLIKLSSEESELASRSLEAALGSTVSGSVVGLFVGGHLDKRSPIEYWESVATALAEKSISFLIFVGPEEAQYADRLEAFVGQNGAVIRPRPLREFAGLMSKVSCLITPDSGPMHLAAAFDIPVIAILRAAISNKFVPQGEQDVSLVHPHVERVIKEVDRVVGHS